MARLNFARSERAELCDLLDAVGPDRRTLCAGWLTRDLAAHLVVRDRRPDAAAGLVFKPLAAHTESVRRGAAARDYSDLVALVRHPPALSMAGVPAIDRAVNTAEFFIHHEDVRRGEPGWAPRNLPRGLDDSLFTQVRLSARFRLRTFGGQVTIASPGYREISAGRGGPSITLTGSPGELTMFFAGRQRASNVTIDGPEDLAGRLRTARFAL
ncbi:MAG TPA: TIGR03085 family metal-binding protein [Micromonosporaceae bacterium]